MTASSEEQGPTLDEFREAASRLEGRIVRTPCVGLVSDRIREALPTGARCVMKLELFQYAGSFKARGALLSMDALTDPQRARGVTGVSAGNHALAVSWAARQAHVSAKLVMPNHADPVRIAGCKQLGAEVVLVEDIHSAFDAMDRIVEAEGRTAIHPFEGKAVTLGTGTCGLEFVSDYPDLDAIVVPVGGGGLISGVSRVFKLIAPNCRVIGVEPVGADTLSRSLEAGEPVSIAEVSTLADSLGSPKAMPYSFGIAKAHVDQVVRIEDREMLRAMALLYDALKIAPEPACAAATAAVMGPLRESLGGAKIGVIACGSNIGEDQFAEYVKRGRVV